MSARERMQWGLVGLGALVVAGGDVLLAYRTEPLVALVAPLAAALVVVVLFRPMLGVYLALLAIPLELTQVRIASAGLSASEGLLFLTAGAVIAHLLVRKLDLRSVWDPSQLALGGLIVVSGLGLLVAVNPTGTQEVVALWTCFLIVSLLVGTASDQQVQRALSCLVLAGAIVGLVALVQTSNIEVVSGGQEVRNRAIGTFDHPNQLAFFLVLTIPVALALAGRGRTPQKVLGLVAAGVEIPALLLSFSRSGIIGLTVSLVVLMAWAGFRRISVLFICGVLAFSVVNSDAISRNKEVSLVTERLQTVTSASGRNQNPRIEIYGVAGQIIADNPWLGIGQRNFGDVSQLYGLRDPDGLAYVHAHDVFLTLAAETGLGGLALFIAFLVLTGRATRRGLRRRPDVQPFVLALGAALAGLLAVAVTEYPLDINVIMATVLIEVGALVAYSRLPRPRPAPADEPEAVARRLEARRARLPKRLMPARPASAP